MSYNNPTTRTDIYPTHDNFESWFDAWKQLHHQFSDAKPKMLTFFHKNFNSNFSQRFDINNPIGKLVRTKGIDVVATCETMSDSSIDRRPTNSFYVIMATPTTPKPSKLLFCIVRKFVQFNTNFPKNHQKQTFSNHNHRHHLYKHSHPRQRKTVP